jgi:ATP-dependent helicase/nuclease subunit A
MTAGARPPVFDVHRHLSEEVRAWQNPREKRKKFGELQKSIANLEQPESVPLSDSARHLVERFEKSYEFEFFTHQAAASSVTALAKGVAPAQPEIESEIAAESAAPFERKLDLPVFFGESAPKATDIGNATHLVLQHWDFAASAGGGKEMARQIDEMISRKLISEADAKLVDRPAIEWLLASSVGELLRANHGSLMREVPFALAQSGGKSPRSDDPMDQLMVRGRIDLLLETSKGLSIVDYKTDNVQGEHIAPRVELYRKQMELYRKSIRQIAGKEVAAIYLVFLKPRLIEEI